MIFATIAGNVGKDGGKLRQAGKDEVCSFSVASSKKGKDGSEQTMWIDCSIWGVRGKALAPHIKQGDKITVVGEFYTEEFNGKTQFRCRVSDVALQGGKRDNDGAARSYGNGAGGSAKHTVPDDVFGDIPNDDAF